MSRRLAVLLLVTDVLFLVYWSVSGAGEVGLFELPASMMYEGYGNPRVCAWNWSFFPLDLAFSATGLMAVRWARREDARWRPMALMSLTLTVVAGLMAVAYWTLMGEFVASWFVPNLLLVLWPLPFMVKLVRDLGQAVTASPSGAR